MIFDLYCYFLVLDIYRSWILSFFDFSIFNLDPDFKNVEKFLEH